MIILRNPSQLDHVDDAYIRSLLTRRFEEITIEGYRHDELGLFLVAQPGDSVADLEETGGMSIVTAMYSDAKYGDPNFSPSHEFLDWHVGHCFEMVHVLSDSGYGVITIIPDQEGIDPALLQFCREYGEPVSDAASPVGGDSPED